MPIYRVRAYDDEHYATLLIHAGTAEAAGADARAFVAAMDLGCVPANHEQEWPDIVRLEQAGSWFDADEPFAPVVESVEVDDEAVPDNPPSTRTGALPR